MRGILRSWRKLRPKDRPQQPAELLSQLRDAYQYPYPDFLRSVDDATALVVAVDRAFDSLVAAAENLRAHTPASNSWDTLSYLLEARLPNEASGLAYRRFLNKHLPLFLTAAAELPPLKGREANSGHGAPPKRPLVRLLVIVICWHVVNVEKQQLRAGFDDEGRSSSRLANLVRATFLGMGIGLDDAALQTEIKWAKRLPLRGIKFWDLIPVLPPRTG